MKDKKPTYSKQYKTSIKGKLRKDLEFYAHDNEMRECEVLRESLRFFLDEKSKRSSRVTGL